MQNESIVSTGINQFAETGGILGLVIFAFFFLIGLNMILNSRREGKQISDILISIQKLRAEFYRSGIFTDRRNNDSSNSGFGRRKDD